VIGTVLAGHPECAAACLHWGVRRGEEFLDPRALIEVEAEIRLEPGTTMVKGRWCSKTRLLYELRPQPHDGSGVQLADT
jgi:hypothetical protein